MMQPSQRQPHPPRPDRSESPLSIVSQFLIYLGPMATAGGALAILRVGKVHRPSLLFSALMIAGLVMIGAGFWLRARAIERSDRGHG